MHTKEAVNTDEEGLGAEMLDLLVDHFQGRGSAADKPVDEPHHGMLMRSFFATAVEAMGLLLVISLAERLRPEPRRRLDTVAAVPHLRRWADDHRRQRS